MNKELVLNILSKIIVNMVVLTLSCNLFNGIIISNLLYLFITSTILMLLNIWIKPLLKIIMLPVNIYTLGLTYPLINIFVLKLTSIIIGDNFIIKGWINTLIISIFISIMTIILDKLIGKSIRGEIK